MRLLGYASFLDSEQIDATAGCMVDQHPAQQPSQRRAIGDCERLQHCGYIGPDSRRYLIHESATVSGESDQDGAAVGGRRDASY